MYKKGQAATEFLMTYGWAILVVVVAIAALAYFGVLSPDQFLPEKCTFPPGIACIDYKITSSSVELYIQNSMGYDITINSVNITDKNCVNSTSVDLVNGAELLYTISCSSTAGSKFKSDIKVNYVNSATNISHSKLGNVVAKVE
ncbi:hypothetical protein KY312_03805 [Candidatus Woesearchaeota archaeon]|nr:hypothetical protein [Candidatus Woesearchaeota archaeon]